MGQRVKGQTDNLARGNTAPLRPGVERHVMIPAVRVPASRRPVYTPLRSSIESLRGRTPAVRACHRLSSSPAWALYLVSIH